MKKKKHTHIAGRIP